MKSTNTSVLDTLDASEIDKIDIMEKIVKKKKLEADKEADQFFSDMSSRESIKMSENIIERLRLKKEVKFTQEFKQKEILNEYANYDKYFSNYKSFSERKYDSDDDGESTAEDEV